MRPVSVLCRLGEQVFRMAWFNNRHPVYERLWQRLSLLWRWITTVFRPIFRYALSALPWRKNVRGGQDESETGDEGNNRAEVERPESRVQSKVWGRGETAEELPECEQERADFNQPREEEDVDEFDRPEYRVDPTDEFYCGYDSTWETEENQGRTSRPRDWPAAPPRHQYKFSRFENAARDMQNYRHDYPSQTRRQRWTHTMTVQDDNPNLNFYLGQKRSVPDGVYIHDFHNKWSGDYYKLEDVHTYIQWLFPLQEPGVNYEASPLTKEEIKAFCKSRIAMENLLQSYKLMLDFYGIKLCNETTGEVKRASNWRDRFNNLNTHTHNNLRITRILKCLGTLGYTHYQEPLVRFFLEETLIKRELPNVKDSVLNYFVFAVLDKMQRRRLIKFAYLHYDRQDEFVWCPKKIQKIWEHERATTHNMEFLSPNQRFSEWEISLFTGDPSSLRENE